MPVSINNLLDLPVETQSGQSLGRVSSFDIDTDNHRVTRYYVKTGLIKGLWHQELMVDPSQVISIDEEKMVVEDNVSKEPVVEPKLATSPTK